MTLKIQFFGTGSAHNANVNTTHFRIYDENTSLFTDSGSGQVLAKKIIRGEIAQPKHIFITHAHTDHFLGLPHLIRVAKTELNIYLSDNLFIKLVNLMRVVGLTDRFQARLNNGILKIHTFTEGDKFKIDNWLLEPIDLYSDEEEQFGYKLITQNKIITFFGDEAVKVLDRKDLKKYKNSDILICEALCTSKEVSGNCPYGWNHITSLDAGKIALKLEAKNLIMSHISEDIDKTIYRNTQLENIKNDAKTVFNGNIFAPKDFEILNFD